MRHIDKSFRLAAIAIAMVIGAQQKTFALTGVCDIYQTAGDPCGAAYSTTRALFGAYTGNLYQVKNSSGTTKDIGVLSAGYVANSAVQDTFCKASTCTISKIYDQTGNGNDLTKAPGGSAAYGPNPDIEAQAAALPIKLDGHQVYGLHVTPNSSWTGTTQVGYRFVGAGKGIATGDNPETIYEVVGGTYACAECCFDFGNAEQTAVAGGDGYMEAIYFGTVTWWDKGTGNGPWIMADLEVGVYSQGGASGATNSSDKSWTNSYVTAMLKGNTHSNPTTAGGPFTLEGADATTGNLTPIYDGASPNGYSPMHRPGGIVLGVGGDNSGTSCGNFYEGVMTKGYATTATDALIQANIVAAGYGKTTTSISNRVGTESSTSLRFDASNARAVVDYSLQNGGNVSLDVVDLRGRHVASVVSGPVSAGQHQAVWNARGMPSGIYVARLSVDGRENWTGKIVLGE
ncbi:MAG TPA: arabinofuranosidase catalytic domain-containing protein [Fibrobacteria bacterium]|nr:arabinofuranosidase catalytic domain-containing protein [Fibrobacteria bacterium]